jgi:uncharacterized phiE125 gp8 family phage protein
MWDRIERLSQPAVEALTLDDVKLHGHIDSADENAWLLSAIKAARQAIEGPRGYGFAIVAAQWRLPLDAFPAEIWIAMGPVLSIDAIAYCDAAGTLQTLAPSRYQWRKGHNEARIKPVYGDAWPSTREQYDAVQVTFTAGYAGTENDPPDLAGIDEPLKVAMLMLIRHWDANRETVAVGQIPAEMPHGFTDLINRYRVGRFA